MIDEDDASNSYHKHVKASTIPASEEIVDTNEEEEKDEQVEYTEQGKPPSDISLFNDKAVST
jgi:hypothetical protein